MQAGFRRNGTWAKPHVIWRTIDWGHGKRQIECGGIPGINRRETGAVFGIHEAVLGVQSIRVMAKGKATAEEHPAEAGRGSAFTERYQGERSWRQV